MLESDAYKPAELNGLPLKDEMRGGEITFEQRSPTGDRLVQEQQNSHRKQRHCSSGTEMRLGAAGTGGATGGAQKGGRPEEDSRACEQAHSSLCVF